MIFLQSFPENAIIKIYTFERVGDMKLLVLILNKVETLEPLLARFTDLQINGATILNSAGMARALSDYMDDSF